MMRYLVQLAHTGSQGYWRLTHQGSVLPAIDNAAGSERANTRLGGLTTRSPWFRLRSRSALAGSRYARGR